MTTPERPKMPRHRLAGASGAFVAAALSLALGAPAALALSLPDEIEKEMLILEANAKCWIYARRSDKPDPGNKHLVQAVQSARVVIDFLGTSPDHRSEEIDWIFREGLTDVYAGLFVAEYADAAEAELEDLPDLEAIEARAHELYTQSNCSVYLP